MEIIRSRQNPLIKHAIKLAELRRERLKSQQTLLIGTHLIESAQAANWSIDKLLINEGHEADAEVQACLSRHSGKTVMLDRTLFDEIEQAPSSSGIIAIASLRDEPSIAREGFCLLLEGVQDPGNVGSILRSAAAAGVAQVWLSVGCADVWSPKVLRAGMGAHFRLSIADRVDIDAALANFQGDIAVTTLDNASSLYAASFSNNVVFAFGSEGLGVSEALLAKATQRIHIPMTSAVESLNVAAAAAICLFEYRRQHLPLL